MNLNTDFKNFIKLLNKNSIKYLLVGGYAVAYYGYPRYTKDIDIWIECSKDNAEKILNIFDEFGFKKSELNISDFTTEGNIVQLGYPPCRIDILTSIDGVFFEDCFKNKNVAIIDEIDINIINLKDLIKNKKASGRYQDLADLEKLDID